MTAKPASVDPPSVSSAYIRHIPVILLEDVKIIPTQDILLFNAGWSKMSQILSWVR